MTKSRSPLRPAPVPVPVPVLTVAQEVYLSAITTSGNFTLAAALKMYAGTVRLRDLVTTDPEIMCGVPIFAGTRVPIDIVLASLDSCVDWDRLVASYPFLTESHVVAAKAYCDAQQAAPPECGKVISSIIDTLDAADAAMNSKLEPRDEA
jgi:uncharacterized protein (DUF433 family)